MICFGVSRGFEAMSERFESVTAERRPHADPAPTPCDVEVSDWDEQTYALLVSSRLSPARRHAIAWPRQTYPDQDAVLATHWHPDGVPMELIRHRIGALFPSRTAELVIPTPHNRLAAYGELAGAEIDCYAPEIRDKVQLLIHLPRDRAARATALTGILEQAAETRARLLLRILEELDAAGPTKRLGRVATKITADPSALEFVQLRARKLRALIDRNRSKTPAHVLRPRLFRLYLEALRGQCGDRIADQGQALIRALSKALKRDEPAASFHSIYDIITEVRAARGGVVVPHPQKFPGVLETNYDVDGYEVWSPGWPRKTSALIDAIAERSASRKARPFLMFLADDCHLGEKLRPANLRCPKRAAREIGVQAGWDDPAIRSCLERAGVTRRGVIEAYRHRLLG
jgi:hypothetical protein